MSSSIFKTYILRHYKTAPVVCWYKKAIKEAEKLVNKQTDKSEEELQRRFFEDFGGGLLILNP